MVEERASQGAEQTEVSRSRSGDSPGAVLST